MRKEQIHTVKVTQVSLHASISGFLRIDLQINRRETQIYWPYFKMIHIWKGIEALPVNIIRMQTALVPRQTT